MTKDDIALLAEAGAWILAISYAADLHPDNRRTGLAIEERLRERLRSLPPAEANTSTLGDTVESHEELRSKIRALRSDLASTEQHVLARAQERDELVSELALERKAREAAEAESDAAQSERDNLRLSLAKALGLSMEDASYVSTAEMLGAVERMRGSTAEKQGLYAALRARVKTREQLIEYVKEKVCEELESIAAAHDLDERSAVSDNAKSQARLLAAEVRHNLMTLADVIDNIKEDVNG